MINCKFKLKKTHKLEIMIIGKCANTFSTKFRLFNILQQDLKPANTGLVEESQKQAANPLFVAISGFVGVAVLFMVGVILMPRIFGDFHFRNGDEDDDDFLDLTKTINEAMDNENCTEHTAYKRIDKRTAFTTRPMITR